MTRALLLENVHPVAIDLLQAAGIEVLTRPGALDESDLIAALDGVELLGIRSKTHVTKAVLAGAEQLQAIGAFCIGTTQIDLPAAAEHGVAVFNAPFSNTRSVVELAIGEIIALTRRLTVLNSALHKGIWNKTASGAHELRGRTLGIVGYGNIGSQLSVLAESMGMSVVFYDVEEKLALGNARRAATLHELLGATDIVTLHVDDRDTNRGLFGVPEFEAMRPGALFLNLSRGFVVDYPALRAAIEAKQVAGAAVDVFPDEPLKQGDEFISDLRGLDNVILTPHIGGSTLEAQHSIGQFVAGKLRDYLAYGSTAMSVNLPNLTLATANGEHRLAHLHRNVPGVLATVNQALAEHGANIASQLLATRGEYGYVVTDIGTPVKPGVSKRLADMPETIRLRVLS